MELQTITITGGDLGGTDHISVSVGSQASTALQDNEKTLLVLDGQTRLSTLHLIKSNPPVELETRDGAALHSSPLCCPQS